MAWLVDPAMSEHHNTARPVWIEKEKEDGTATREVGNKNAGKIESRKKWRADKTQRGGERQDERYVDVKQADEIERERQREEGVEQHLKQ